MGVPPGEKIFESRTPKTLKILSFFFVHECPMVSQNHLGIPRNAHFRRSRLAIFRLTIHRRILHLAAAASLSAEARPISDFARSPHRSAIPIRSLGERDPPRGRAQSDFRYHGITRLCATHHKCFYLPRITRLFRLSGIGEPVDSPDPGRLLLPISGLTRPDFA